MQALEPASIAKGSLLEILPVSIFWVLEAVLQHGSTTPGMESNSRSRADCHFASAPLLLLAKWEHPGDHNKERMEFYFATR